MLTAHSALSFGERRYDHIGKTEVVQTDGGRDDVHDRVHRADFMEVDFFERRPVRLRFRLAKNAEDVRSDLFRMIRDPGSVDDVQDLRKAAMRVFVRMFVIVGMCVAVRVGVIMRMIMVMGMSMPMGMIVSMFMGMIMVMQDTIFM